MDQTISYTYPVWIDALFVILVLVLSGISLQIANYRRGSLAIGVWLGMTGALAKTGFFLDFSGTPPKFAFAVLPSFALMLWIAFGRYGRLLAQENSPRWIVDIQSFRVIMEVILWLLFAHHALPIEMTFEGRNFDILVGASAPIVVRYALGSGKNFRPRWALAWNVLGMVILTNVVAHGILSTPTIFQVLQTDPANRVIGQFPLIWLPVFVVPLAYLLHIISIRQIIGRKR